jgi:translation initiation factor 3 subunit H
MEVDPNTIHVSSSFGHPEKRQAAAKDDDDEEGDGKKHRDRRGVEEEEAAYEAEMLRMLKAVNVDANIVGCYTSMFLGTFTPSLLSAPHPLVLLYDPAQSSSSATGNIVVRCFKLRESAIEGDSTNGLYDEWAVKVSNNGLARSALYDLNRANKAKASTVLKNNDYGKSGSVDFERLDLSTNPFVEKNLSFLSTWVDELVSEQSKYSNFARSLYKEEQAGSSVDKASRWKQGGPSRLDGLLAGTQLDTYCDNVLGHGQRGIKKTWVMGAVSAGK